MASLLKGWLLASANFALLYLVSILISRWLGPEDFGVYSVAVAVVTILASAATMGLEKLGAEELPIYSKHLKWDLYRGFSQAYHTAHINCRNYHIPTVHRRI